MKRIIYYDELHTFTRCYSINRLCNCSKISTKLGIPTLLFFIGLGMLFGSEGIFKIDLKITPLLKKSALPL